MKSINLKHPVRCHSQTMSLYLNHIAMGSLRLPKTNKIVAIDYGIKENILRIMKNLGGDITVVPPSTTAKEIEVMNPDGIFLSNGPGDPTILTESIQREVKELMKLDIPMFGICLGHQIMSLAYDLGLKRCRLVIMALIIQFTT